MTIRAAVTHALDPRKRHPARVMRAIGTQYNSRLQVVTYQQHRFKPKHVWANDPVILISLYFLN
jgi:hypothetical protein